MSVMRMSSVSSAAAEPGRGGADRHADEEHHDLHHEGHGHADARAVHQAAEQVTAKVIGAEEVRADERVDRPARLGDSVVGPGPGSSYGASIGPKIAMNDEPQHDDAAQDGEAILEQAAECVPPQ